LATGKKVIGRNPALLHPASGILFGTGSMRILLCSIFIVQGIWCGACGTVSVRPVHEAFKADREFDGGIWFAFPRMSFRHTAEFEQKIESSRYGIEVAIPVDRKIEFFADVNHASAEYFYWFYIKSYEFIWDWRVDGEEIGIGARSMRSHDPGWGLDWGIRFKLQDMDDTRIIYNTLSTTLEVTSHGADFNIGPYYTIPLENGYFFSPQGGLLVKAENGEVEEKELWTRMNLDYKLFSTALYAGFRLNAENLNDLTLAVNGYAGTSHLWGYFLSLGIRF
jgi:hypothetical protein